MQIRTYLLRAVTVFCMLGTHLTANAAEETVPVRVAAYNVEFGKNASPEEIGAMLRPYDLDVIGFCEAPDGEWTCRVGKVLGMRYAYVGKVSSANHKDKYKTILSRTPLEETREHLLNAGKGWNPASTVRAVTTIRGIRVAFYSLHICASGKDDGHAHLLATEVLPKETAERIIVVGDFNNELGDPAVDTILGSGMNLTWKDLRMDLSGLATYNALKPQYNEGVIDHIFYNTASGGKTARGGIIELKKPLSDHKPVWAEIVFPK